MEEESLAPSEQRGADLDLASLVLEPREDDVLLFAIPVVAPYRTVQRAKYKVRRRPSEHRSSMSPMSAL